MKSPTLDHVILAGLLLLAFLQAVDCIIPTPCIITEAREALVNLEPDSN